MAPGMGGRSPVPLPTSPRCCFLGFLAQNESPGDFYFYFFFLFLSFFATLSRAQAERGILGGLSPGCPRRVGIGNPGTRDTGQRSRNFGDPREGIGTGIPEHPALSPPSGRLLRGQRRFGAGKVRRSHSGRGGDKPQKRVRSGKERVNGCGSPRSGSHTPLPRAGLTHPGLRPAPRHPRSAPQRCPSLRR